ncbi:MAG: SsrA-binding protein SmpB [Deltaproteobacteria bacterium]|jgi:SsrA-binding protein|nr:SsrA-binding protein SmpB [Deltaproteobacteria bacterium]
MAEKHAPTQLAQNKKARHYYELLDFVEAGLILTGPEVKSIRAGLASFHDAYVFFRQGEAYARGLRISPYANAGYAAQDPDRERKLLLHAAEIRSLSAKVEQKGLSIIPVNLHLRRGHIKMELALARGKKMHDQRLSLKEAAELRDMQREIAGKYK